MFEFIKWIIPWLFSGLGIYIYSCYKEKTKWINIENKYFVEIKNRATYGYIVPNNFHPITFKQYLDLLDTNKVNGVEKKYILDNINEKAIIWKVKVGNLAKEKKYYKINGSVEGTGFSRKNRLIFIFLEGYNKSTLNQIKTMSYIYVKGVVNYQNGIISINQGKILSIRGKFIDEP